MAEYPNRELVYSFEACLFVTPWPGVIVDHFLAECVTMAQKAKFVVAEFNDVCIPIREKDTLAVVLERYHRRCPSMRPK